MSSTDNSKEQPMEVECTKPNCDCIQIEIEKQGTECIKSYPCLAKINDHEDEKIKR